MLRRIERRLQVNVLPVLITYRDYLRAQPDERDQDVKRCADAGFAAHIGKPIVLDALATVVERVALREAAE